MPLEIKPMAMADLVHYEAIVTEAFRNTIQKIFYPDGVSAEAQAAAVASAEKQWAASEETAAKTGHEPALHFMKVVDTDLGPDAPYDGIVGVAKWNVYAYGRSEAELRKEEEEARTAFDGSEGNEAPSGLNIEAVREFKRALRETKRSLFNTGPYMILQVLVTAPEHFRRGVGAMHLQWGQDVADRHGIPMYLESSAMGRPLYRRWGYQDMMDIPFDAREWGADSALTHFAMIRPAKSVNGAVKGGKLAGDAVAHKEMSNGAVQNGYMTNGKSERTTVNGNTANGIANKDILTNGHAMNGGGITAQA